MLYLADQVMTFWWLTFFYVTRALQPVATCRQSPYLHKLAIMTSFSLWRCWADHAQRYERTLGLRTYRQLTAFNIWRFHRWCRFHHLLPVVNDYRDSEVFPGGSKLPVTNLPASATGPVQRSVCLFNILIISFHVDWFVCTRVTVG